MKPLFQLLFAIAIVLVFNSCDDTLDTDAGTTGIAFSKDTLTFDTVFTTIGSATARVMVYNRRSQPLIIENLYLAGGNNSPFRVNVDGSTNKDHRFGPITLRARDSMYIFVEVKINPLQSDAPILIRDSILFTTDDGSTKMVLEAFGQDMEVLRSLRIRKDTLLNAKLPYLIYGDLVVDTAATLKLAPGTRLFFHNNSNLLVYGNLKAEGTRAEPVSIRGDRMDKIGFTTPVPYNLVAGQWGGVYLLNPTGNHVLRNVNINSGYVGIYYVNRDKQNKPHLEISDCRIHNFLFYNLVEVNGDMTVSNSAITNSGGYTVYLNGGRHTFYHCTIANYFNNPTQSVARDNAPAFMMMTLARSYPMVTRVYNSIIAGSAQNELSLASRFDSLYKADIAFSYIKRTKALDLPQFRQVRWSALRDTVFKGTVQNLEKELTYNFMPDSVSPARGIADPEMAKRFPFDLNGRNRLADGAPDAGAYEWGN